MNVNRLIWSLHYTQFMWIWLTVHEFSEKIFGRSMVEQIDLTLDLNVINSSRAGREEKYLNTRNKK